MMPEVSIITTSYNKERYIGETIRSVLQQSYTCWEFIIIDDFSNDRTVEVISGFLTDERIIFIKNKENKGANYSRNLGARLARGEYIIFLDADDVLSPTCLQERLTCLCNNPGGDLYIFSMGVFIMNIGDDNRKWISNSQEPLKDFLQHKLPWLITQPLWRSDFLRSIGGFDEEMQRMQDVELHTRALLEPGVKYFLYPNIIDCYYRIDENRKKLNEYDFMKRLVGSAVAYCNKFEKKINQPLHRYLYGTIFQISLSMIYSVKQGRLSREEYEELQKHLFSSTIYNQAGWVKKTIFYLALFYNLYLIRVIGINRMFSFLIVL